MTAVKPAHMTFQATPLLRLHLRPGDEEDHEELEDDAGGHEDPRRPQIRDRHDEIERHLSPGNRPDRRDDEQEVLVVFVPVERDARVEGLEPAVGSLLRLRLSHVARHSTTTK